MSRPFVFLLGVLVGAAGMYYLHTRRLEPTPVEKPSMPAVVATESPTSPADYPPLTSPPTDVTPAAPMPGAMEPGDVPSLPAPAPVDPLAPAQPIGVAMPPMPTDLLLPVSGIKATQLLDTYTQTRGAGRLHDAIDIMAARGTPVVAVTDGKVAKLFDSRQGGLTLYQFDRNEAIAYYYAHLDSYAAGVAEGKVLKRGDLVGYVGSTGNANPDGPHLHFAVFVLGPEKNWWQGTAVNPYPLLARTANAR